MTICTSTIVYSQQENIDKKSETEPYPFAEKTPEFPGGEEALSNFIEKNIEYPKQAVIDNIQGTVMAEFVVCEDGSICNLNFINSPDKSLEEASRKALSKMPNWIPGEIKGEKVRVSFEMPIRFHISK